MTRAASLALVCLGLVVGCNGEKIGYRQAGQLHGQRIGYIAAMSTFLPNPSTPQPDGPRRVGARIAKAEILKHALAGRDTVATSEWNGAGKHPVERVAESYTPLIAACTTPLGEPLSDEWKRAALCFESISKTNAELANHDGRASKLGLPKGTIPLIEEKAIHGPARIEQKNLADALAPSPAELLRRQIWEEESTDPKALYKACEDSLAAVTGRPAEIVDEISYQCAPLSTLEGILRQGEACGDLGRQDCYGLSLCGLLRGHAEKSDTPKCFRLRLRTYADRCDRMMARRRAEMAEQAGEQEPAPLQIPGQRTNP